MSNKKIIRLNAAEIQSGISRVRTAEALIMQLPREHDGRNTWLLNYGTGAVAVELRARKGLKWNSETQSCELAGKREDGYVLKNNTRTLELTFEEISLIQQALGIAETAHTETFKQTLSKLVNVRNNDEADHQRRIAQYYHVKSCEFADLNIAIAGSKKDV